jgi:hypothetical protein
MRRRVIYVCVYMSVKTHLYPYKTPVKIILCPHNNYLLHSHDLNYVHTTICTQTYTIIETYTPDHLPSILSSYSTISDGHDCMDLHLVTRRALPAPSLTRPQPPSTVRSLLEASFFPKKLKRWPPLHLSDRSRTLSTFAAATLMPQRPP